MSNCIKIFIQQNGTKYYPIGVRPLIVDVKDEQLQKYISILVFQETNREKSIPISAKYKTLGTTNGYKIIKPFININGNNIYVKLFDLKQNNFSLSKLLIVDNKLIIDIYTKTFNEHGLSLVENNHTPILLYNENTPCDITCKPVDESEHCFGSSSKSSSKSSSTIPTWTWAIVGVIVLLSILTLSGFFYKSRKRRKKKLNLNSFSF